MALEIYSYHQDNERNKHGEKVLNSNSDIVEALLSTLNQFQNIDS